MKVLVAGLIILIGFVAFAAYLAFRPRPDRGGFRDWVKDPAYRESVEREFAKRKQARESLRVPHDISDAEIERMVERLFVLRDDDFNDEKLALIPIRALPALRKAIDDPRAIQEYPGRKWSDTQFPMQRICDLLIKSDPALVLDRIGKWMSHSDKYLRKDAAIFLGTIGTADCVDVTLKALADEDDYVRSYTMMGIDRGIDSGTCEKNYLDGIFDGLVKLLNRHDGAVGGEAPKLVLRIDPARAVPIMTSSRFLAVDNPELHHLIEALNQFDIRIPPDKVRSLMGQLLPRLEKYPNDYSYGELLLASALNPDDDAEKRIRADLDSKHERVCESAAKALGILSGIRDPFAVVIDKLETQGEESLSPAQRIFLSVKSYDGEVQNGGHSQYFVNSSGDRWKSAIAGLAEIGASERERILKDAAGLFGRDGPSENRDLRHEQLAKFSSAQDKKFEALDTKYYECKENLDKLLLLYAVDRKREFVSSSSE